MSFRATAAERRLIRVERATYSGILAQPVFRTVFVTRTLGITADTLRVVALSTLVLASTGSPFLAAVAFGVGFVPQAVGAVGLGTLADRLRPRTLIVAGYTAETAAGLTIALWHPPVVVTLLIVGGVALFTPLFSGAGNRLVADVLTGDAFVLSRSLIVVASSIAQLFGLAVGAATVATLSPTGALFATAGAHALAATWSALRLPDSVPAVPASGAAVGESWRVTRELLGNRWVRVLLLAHWLPPAVTTGAEALLIPYAERADFPAAAGGVLLACSPIGMLLGNVAVGRWLAPATRERIVVPLIVASGIPLLAFAANPGLSLAGALIVVTGAGYAYALGLQRQFLDAVPQARRGQAFGLLHAGMMTFQGLGPAVLGLATEALPIGVTIAVAGLATVALAGAFALPLRRGERQLS